MTPPPVYAGGQVATGSQVGFLGNRSFMDTPFSQISITAQRIQDSQQRTIRDVLLDDPSVRERNPIGGTDPDAVNIRGFAVSSGDITYNGLYGILPSWSIASEVAERVEILKGPSALLNGMPPGGSIGGTINIVPKRAQDTPITQLTTSFSSNGQPGVHVDLGRRAGDNNEFGIRYNGVLRKGDTSVDGQQDQMLLGVLGLDYRGERLRLSTDFGYQDQRIDGVIPLATPIASIPVPRVIDTSRNWGQPWSYDTHKDKFAMARGEFDVTSNVMAYAAYGVKESNQLIYDAGYATINNLNGDTTQFARKYGSFFEYKSGEAGLRMQVATGPVEHSINVAYSSVERESGARANNLLPGFTSNLYNPTFIAPPPIADPIVLKQAISNLQSVGVADTMSIWNKRVQLTVGVRKQNVGVDNYSNVTGLFTNGYEKDAFSPAYALVVKPVENVSLYASYIEGLQQGAIIPGGFANSGTVLPPYQSKQYETGVKVDWGRFATNFALFQITQPSLVTVGTAPNNYRLPNGEQQNRGMEITTFGEVMSGVRVLGGVMFLDATLTRTQGGLADGLRAASSPEVNVSLGGEWDTPFVRGLTLTGRAIYTSSQLVEATAPRRSIPAWERFDVGMRYTNENIRTPTGGPIVFRFNIDNVLDKDYWVAVNSGYLATGAPRTYRLSTTFNF